MQTLFEWQGKVLGKKQTEAGLPDPSARAGVAMTRGWILWGHNWQKLEQKFEFGPKKKKKTVPQLCALTNSHDQGGTTHTRQEYLQREECAQPCSSEPAPKSTSETRL